VSTDTRVVETTLSDANAVGIALDNPDDPHVAVAVHGGRIVYVGISDAMIGQNPQEVQDVINACILSAFSMWGAQRMGVIEL
jgi:hypothetical protein